MSEPSTERVAAFIAIHGIDAEIIPTPDGVPTVPLAALALGVDEEQIIKTLLFQSPGDELVVAIANGTGRIDRHKLAVSSGVEKLKLASPELVLSATGYPAGGVAPVGLPDGVPVFIDHGVMEHDEVFGGAGTDLQMMRIRTSDLVALNHAIVADIVQQAEA